MVSISCRYIEFKSSIVSNQQGRLGNYYTITFLCQNSQIVQQFYNRKFVKNTFDI